MVPIVRPAFCHGTHAQKKHHRCRDCRKNNDCREQHGSDLCLSNVSNINWKNMGGVPALINVKKPVIFELTRIKIE